MSGDRIQPRFEPDVLGPFSVDCPYCRRPNDAFTATSGPTPDVSDGDVSICFGCERPAVIVVDDHGVRLRAAGPIEEALLAPQLSEFIARLRRFKARTRGPRR